MFAVIETGGKQYLVSKDKKLKIEKLPQDVGSEVSFNNVLLISDGKTTTIGRPYIEGASVGGEIVALKRAKKIHIFRYHSKTRHRRAKGHRQPYSEIVITSIKR